MTTFVEQRILDNNARFNSDELAVIITYNGDDIPAFVEHGQDRATLPGNRGVADQLEILVRRSDITTTSKSTPVIIDNGQWKVLREIGGSSLNCRIALIANEAPIPRRSL